MKMKAECRKYLNLYMKNGRLGLSVRFHAARCPKCREEILRLETALKTVQGISPFQMERDVSGYVMQRIMSLPPYNAPAVSIGKWLSAGLLILISIFLIPFNSSMQEMRLWAGGMFDIFLTVVMGLVISVYAGMFTISLFKTPYMQAKIAKLIRDNGLN